MNTILASTVIGAVGFTALSFFLTPPEIIAGPSDATLVKLPRRAAAAVNGAAAGVAVGAVLVVLR